MRRLEAEISEASRIIGKAIRPSGNTVDEFLRQELRKKELSLRYDLDEGIISHADVQNASA